MARPTREQLRKIIMGENLNVDIVERPARRDAPRRVEAGTPDLAALKRRFLGDAAADAGDVALALDDEDLGSVDVRSAGAAHVDSGEEPRTTVVSGSMGRAIGEQG